MKTYKGYNKLPYCNTHYPSTKFTAVADTPENLRLKKNTTNQSSVVYHKDFEQERGKFTAVADDPETTRARKTQKQASGVEYQQRVLGEAPASHYGQNPRRESYDREPAAQTQYAPPPQPPQPEPTPPPAAASSKDQYIAVYDYAAADDDEVSFSEGDIIINGEAIDEGWMTGTVKSTGQTGMLPSNYVEKC